MGSKMNYAKLFGLKEKISDEELIKLLESKQAEIHIDKVTIKKPDLTDKGVSGYFGTSD